MRSPLSLLAAGVVGILLLVGSAVAFSLYVQTRLFPLVPAPNPGSEADQRLIERALQDPRVSVIQDTRDPSVFHLCVVFRIAHRKVGDFIDRLGAVPTMEMIPLTGGDDVRVATRFVTVRGSTREDAPALLEGCASDVQLGGTYRVDLLLEDRVTGRKYRALRFLTVTPPVRSPPTVAPIELRAR